MIPTYWLSLNKKGQFVIERTRSEKGEKTLGLKVKYLGLFKKEFLIEKIPKFLVHDNVIIREDNGETEKQARLIFQGTNGDGFIYNISPRLESYISSLKQENSTLKLQIEELKKKLYNWKNEDLRRTDEIKSMEHSYKVKTAFNPAETFGYGGGLFRGGMSPYIPPSP